MLLDMGYERGSWVERVVQVEVLLRKKTGSEKVFVPILSVKLCMLKEGFS